MSEKTVFVIGAGASKEVLLPTAPELISQIIQLLDLRYDDFGFELISGDYLIKEALKIYVQINENTKDINPYLHQALHISDALPQAISIDNFIDNHRENEKIALCGKLAIVRSILEAEKTSLLFFERTSPDSKPDFSSLNNTWYSSLFKLLSENCSADELEERFQSIVFIIFNYDRCVEHFIYYALQNYYRISDSEAANLVKKVKFYHPYGSVGSLPWIDQNNAINFGAEPRAEKLLELSQRIKTFTESTDPKSIDIEEIKNHMNEAPRIVFLGFAFHKLNMELLTPEYDKDKKEPVVRCFATTLGISDSDKDVIETQIRSVYRSRHDIYIEMKNVPCNKIFAEYWRGLAF